MPLLFLTHPFPRTAFGLWKIAEQESYFRDDLPLSEAESTELARHQNPLRRLEWLAGRWLLHKLTDAPERLALAKDAFSKPFFPDHQHLACSLSHSKGTVGALILENEDEAAPLPAIGCDIQVLTEKMRAIAPKFLNESEREWVNAQPETLYLELLHLYWTAKESLYKAYGLKELDFRKHLFVEDLHWDGSLGLGRGRVEKGAISQVFSLLFGKIETEAQNALVWAVCRQL